VGGSAYFSSAKTAECEGENPFLEVCVVDETADWFLGCTYLRAGKTGLVARGTWGQGSGQDAGDAPTFLVEWDYAPSSVQLDDQRFEDLGAPTAADALSPDEATYFARLEAATQIVADARATADVGGHEVSYVWREQRSDDGRTTVEAYAFERRDATCGFVTHVSWSGTDAEKPSAEDLLGRAYQHVRFASGAQLSTVDASSPNATIYQSYEVDGKTWELGAKSLSNGSTDWCATSWSQESSSRGTVVGAGYCQGYELVSEYNWGSYDAFLTSTADLDAAAESAFADLGDRAVAVADDADQVEDLGTADAVVGGTTVHVRALTYTARGIGQTAMVAWYDVGGVGVCATVTLEGRADRMNVAQGLVESCLTVSETSEVAS